jgi:hypothetical protein
VLSGSVEVLLLTFHNADKAACGCGVPKMQLCSTASARDGSVGRRNAVPHVCAASWNAVAPLVGTHCGASTADRRLVAGCRRFPVNLCKETVRVKNYIKRTYQTQSIEGYKCGWVSLKMRGIEVSSSVVRCRWVKCGEVWWRC